MGSLAGWNYRKSVTASRATGAVTDYPMKVLVGESDGAAGYEVHCGGKCKSDFTDLRFTPSDGVTLLPFWIESITGTTPNQLATIWINCDSIGTTDTTFYMYYGNSDATSIDDGEATFDFFDDFSGDLSNWATSGGVSIVSEICQITGANSYIDSNDNFSNGYVPRARSKTVTKGSYSMPIQMRDGPTENYLARWLNVNTTYEYVTCNVGNTATSIGQTTDYHVREIHRISSTSGKFYYDDALAIEKTSNVPTNSLKVGARANGHDVYVDWILMRKFSDPEPVWGDWGEEEGELGVGRYFQIDLDAIMGNADYFLITPEIKKQYWGYLIFNTGQIITPHARYLQIGTGPLPFQAGRYLPWIITVLSRIPKPINAKWFQRLSSVKSSD